MHENHGKQALVFYRAERQADNLSHDKKALWIVILVIMLAMAGCSRGAAQTAGGPELAAAGSELGPSSQNENSSAESSIADQGSSSPDDSSTDPEVLQPAQGKEEILMGKIRAVYGEAFHLSPAESVNIDGEDCPAFHVLMNVNDEAYTTVAITEDQSKVYEKWLLNDEWTPW